MTTDHEAILGSLRCHHVACGHDAVQHAGGFCGGPTVSGKPCPCRHTPQAIAEHRLGQFGEVTTLRGGEAAASLVDALRLDRGPHSYRDQAAMTRLVLNSEKGRQLWDAYVDYHAYRSDGLGQRMISLCLTFPTLKAAIYSGGLPFADLTEKIDLNEQSALVAEGLRAGRMLLVGGHWATGWSAFALERWAFKQRGGALHAAAFVLGVWANSQAWVCGTFDMHDALKAWDDDHVEAFGNWLSNAWWA